MGHIIFGSTIYIKDLENKRLLLHKHMYDNIMFDRSCQRSLW